jgi:hypothetical protein
LIPCSRNFHVVDVNYQVIKRFNRKAHLQPLSFRGAIPAASTLTPQHNFIQSTISTSGRAAISSATV